MRIQIKTLWQNKDAGDAIQFDDVRPAAAYQASSPLNGAWRTVFADELGNGADDSSRSIRCNVPSESKADKPSQAKKTPLSTLVRKRTNGGAVGLSAKRHQQLRSLPK